jgi:hypothetical protein
MHFRLPFLNGLAYYYPVSPDGTDKVSMNQSDKDRAAVPQEGDHQPLPLFRMEALASQQQKLYGEILLIRPLSLTFLGWLGVGLAGCVLGFLLLGKITEKARVFGVVQGQGHARAEAQTEADLFVPGRLVKFLQPGETLLLLGPADGRQTVTVRQISDSVVSPAEIPQQEKPVETAPVYRVVVTLSSPISSAASTTNSGAAASPGARVEAEIPLGRKPLIKWLFERSGV